MELDQYQKKAYLTKENKVLIVAPPGSGKTTVMLKRLSQILEEGISGDQVVVLTFSKASAVEMEQRFVHTSKNKPFFGTIHGLCYKILRQRQGKLDMIFGKEEFLIRNRMQKELKIDQSDVDSLFRDISKYKVYQYLEEGTITLTHRDELFKKAYQLYEEERIKRGLLDFDDLQIEVLKEFSKPEVLKEFKQKHTHILIDEFQDLDPIQLKLIQKISQGQKLFCVGDEDQCIYAFRGSDPKGMIDFETMFKGKKLYLKYNYRSTENIVNYAGDVISKNALRNDKELLASRKEQRKIIKIFPENQEMMLYDMAKEIKKDDFTSYAILYRTNREGLRVKEYLRKEKIAFHSRDNFNFFKSFIAKDILDYIRVVYQDDPQAFLRIANKPYRYISKDDLRKIGLGEDMSKVLLEPKKNRFALDNNRSFLKELSLMKKKNMNKLVSYIEKILGYEDYLISYADRTGRDEDELFEDLREMEEVVSYYDNPIELLIASAIDPDEKEAKVTLSTVHGVKGLEFDKVFVINAVEGYMPHAASMEDLEEERRIFYVAITRAREELNIYSPRFIHGKERKRSRFIL